MNLSRDVTDGLKNGLLMGAAVLVLVVPQVRHHGSLAPSLVPSLSQADMGSLTAPAESALTPGADSAAAIERKLDLGSEIASRDVRRVAQWVVESADNGTRNFVILDKRNAKVFVFEPGGKLLGASPVLLGYAAGDDTVPGIGERPIEQVRPQERTTPAGRFVAEPGRNARQEDVVWVDYDAAVSMHRVITTNPKEHRLERLATPTAADNRISYGCINLPPSFFESVLFPVFRGHKGIVYVLPEVKSLVDVFPGVKNNGLRMAGGRASPPPI
ncbi:hypothetical protein [Ideonella sp. YS5]|uniref:hypothetical protein n=1 Tax=Ideonella sp. YS5 TaxID=3453714 RepID=UPI003EEFC381